MTIHNPPAEMQTDAVIKDKTFNLRLNEEDRARLDRVAQSMEVSAATAVRMLIKQADEKLGLAQRFRPLRQIKSNQLNSGLAAAALRALARATTLGIAHAVVVMCEDREWMEGLIEDDFCNADSTVAERVGEVVVLPFPATKALSEVFGYEEHGEKGVRLESAKKMLNARIAGQLSDVVIVRCVDVGHPDRDVFTTTLDKLNALAAANLL